MAKETEYRMCELLSQNSITHVRGWIEERGAALGCRVTLEDIVEPTGYWNVISVSDQKVNKKVLSDINDSLRGHRKVTDI